MKKRWFRFACMTLAVCAVIGGLTLAGCGSVKETEAVYLGVENYGAPETDHDHIGEFRYRFLIDGEETVLAIDPGERNADGDFEYPVQNVLKEGHSYRITYRGSLRAGNVIAAEEIPGAPVEFSPVVAGEPGVRTLENFLRTAMMPVGTALYIYGGGWNWQDSGPGAEARTIGVSPEWVRFFREQDADFTFKSRDDDEANSDPANSYYPYGGYNEYHYAGLDCSGYVGWVIYNTFQTEDGEPMFFSGSTGWAGRLAGEGWGTWTQDVPDPADLPLPSDPEASVMLPGDVMSINGHVWISLGTCSDGSVVVCHSTPTNSRTGQPGGGVQIGAIGYSEDCEAYQLADRYMAEYFPEWYERYPAVLKEPEIYFVFEGDTAGRFTWDVSGSGGGLTDPEGIQQMTPEEVLAELFS